MALVLGIESSCDETAAALVDSNRRIVAQRIASQDAEHAPYGGVVPEIAARAHAERLAPMIEGVLDDAGATLADCDAVAATAGPGLIGGVMVGLVTAKALAMASATPLIAVNHLEGHALSPRLSDPGLGFPYALLLVSGGHCQILRVDGVGRYRRLATTIDDALGEAFDKTAKILGLGFPGGPAVERTAQQGDPRAVPLPRPMVGSGEPHFSFAGLKSAVLRAHESGRHDAADIAASFQQAAVDCITDRLQIALAGMRDVETLVVAGGVAANAKDPRRAGEPRRATRHALRRAAAVALHRQCGDDRLGRHRAAGSGRLHARPAGHIGASALAARSGGRAGPRSGGQGMSEMRGSKGCVGVLGAGAWGTALAQMLAAGGREVLIWARERELVEEINSTHTNSLFLPSARLSPSIRATGELDEVGALDVLLVVTPAQHTGRVLGAMPRHPHDLVLCSKGIEAGSGRLMNEVASAAAPGSAVAVLSGPTFAHEVAAGLPTAVTLACSAGEEQWERIAPVIARPTFRPYFSDDVTGAEIGGSVKNVLAIACGVVDGLGLGQNARAALIARGYAEMLRFGEALGARAETLAGLCGLGDLVLTCSSTSSRNFSLGKALGEGASAGELLADRHTVAEGAHTAPVLVELAARHGVAMPIVTAVYDLLKGDAPREVVSGLLARPLRAELEGPG